jgi:hypothetical protein
VPESAGAVQPARGWCGDFYDSFWWALFAGPIGIGVGALFQSRALVAALPVVLMFPAYWRGLSKGSAPRVFLLSVIWAAMLSASVIAWTLISPGSAGASILKAVPYRDEMFTLDSHRHRPGRRSGPVSSVSFDPSASFRRRVAGVGRLPGIAHGQRAHELHELLRRLRRAGVRESSVGILVGWHPWSILRVVGFVAIGVSLSLPLLRRRLTGFHHKLMVLGLGLVIIDAIVKAFSRGALGASSAVPSLVRSSG